MKKFIVAIIAIAVIVPLCIFFAFSSANSGAEGQSQSNVPAEILAGDVNGDGNISVLDSISLLLYMAGKPIEIVNDAADVNGDGVVDKKDCGNIIVNAVNNVQESANTDKCEHSLIKEIEAVPATCTENGTAEGWKCTKCNKLFKDQTAKIMVTAAKLTIPASHKIVITPAVAPTCAATGLTEGKHCEVCKTIIEKQNTVDISKEHGEATWITVNESTAFVEGKKAQICQVCKAEFKTEPLPRIILPDSEGLEFTINDDGNGYTLSGIGTCQDSIVVVPASYNGLPITKISWYLGGYVNEIGEPCNYPLKGIIIPDSIKELKAASFWGCEELTDVILGNGIMTIEEATFEYCFNLTNIVLPNSLTAICSRAFGSCYNLTNIVLPSSIKSIDSIAFLSCNIANIVIPSSVTFIGWSAFDFDKAESIVVDDDNSVYHVDGNCLIETKAKKLIAAGKNGIIPNDGSVTIIGEHAFASHSELTYVEIPEGITDIEYGAFEYCENLQTIYIPSSVTNFASSSFYSCNNMQSIIVNDNNTVYRTQGNCLIETQTKTLIRGFKDSVIPNDGSVTTIGPEAFASCFELKNIVIPEGITLIDALAFSWCNLENVILPNTLLTINSQAFAWCRQLTSITMPKSIEFIDYYAFDKCFSLNEITYLGTIEDWKKFEEICNVHFAYETFVTVVHCTDGDYEIERPNYDDPYYPGFGPIIN